MQRLTNILILVLVVSLTCAGMGQVSDLLQAKLEQKVSSLEFRDSSLRDVLRILAMQNGLNIVVSPEVNGRIALTLRNVTVQDVLNSVLTSQGYHYILQNDVIVVKSFERDVFGETESRVFRLNYVDAVDLMETVKPLLSSKGECEVLDLVKTDKLEEMRSDILVVRDVRQNLDQIEQVINEIDQPQQQLIIEVRLIETILGETQKLGFDWPDKVGVTMTGATPDGGVTENFDDPETEGYSAISDFPVNSSSFKLGILTFDQLNFTLDFLATDENSKLISNPKVTTLNNHKAMIRVGTNIPIPEVSRGIGGDLITYKEKEISVILEVTPRIEPNDKIHLDVHPIIEEIIGYTGPGDFPQPITSIREVQTAVSVSPKETLVLGGMVKDTKTTITNKVWLLGDIPLLGELFKSTREEVKKSDLLIFITPHYAEPSP